MARDASGTYTQPLADVVGDTIIEALWANTTTADLATALTDSLSRSGKGGMLAALLNIAGSKANPAISYTDSSTSGSYLAAAGDVRYAIGGVDVVRFTSAGFQIWNTATSAWNSVAATVNLNFTGTSTTSVAIGLGAKTWTIETGKSFVVGMYIQVVDDAAPTTNSVQGTITAYNTATGQLDVTVTRTNGSGTKTAWTVSTALEELPSTVGNAGKSLIVNSGETDVEWSLVYPSIASNAGKHLAVNAGETATEWVATATDYQEFLTSDTWTKPAEATFVYVEVIGAGGGGAYDSVGAAAGGGGGGGFSATTILASSLSATETITIGSGGTGRTTTTGPGLVGGDSTFGSLVTGRGGEGGKQGVGAGTQGGGNGGGGELGRSNSAGSFAQGGYSSGGGSYNSTSSGGDCVKGGGGGASATGGSTGGESVEGGDGGTVATVGTVPGGGGGAEDNTGSAAGDGADGRIRVWSW